MRYNSNKEIWYPEDNLFQLPPLICNYQNYLITGISRRIKFAREKCGLYQRDLYKDAPYRIGLIEKGMYYTHASKQYSSFITKHILSNIVAILNDTIENKFNVHHKKITRFWIIFGNTEEVTQFLKLVYYRYCIDILSSNWQTRSDIELTNTLLNLFYADANFSLIYGQVKTKEINIDTKANIKERRALMDAIKYTWSIISKDIVQEFENVFNNNNQYSDYYLGNSVKIDNQIKKWCKKYLMPLLQKKTKELKQDSVANIGYEVHRLLEMKYESLNILKKDKYNTHNAFLNTSISESTNQLLNSAIKLTEIQNKYLINQRHLEIMQSIADDVDKNKDSELDGEYIDYSSGDIITYGSSGETFEQLLNDAVKNCKKNI